MLKREQKQVMESCLGRIEGRARELEEIEKIGGALIEAATMPSAQALREISRSFGFRLFSMAAIVQDIKDDAETGLQEPEAEEETLTVPADRPSVTLF